MDEKERDFPLVGTIIRRTIRGKDRFYHQWREDGKTRSRYLRADEVLPLRTRLEAAKRSAPESSPLALTGKRLHELVAAAQTLPKRAMLGRIPANALLYGPKNCGKSTLLRQLLAETDQETFSRTAYISIPYDLSPTKLLSALETLVESGIRRVFIDGFDRSQTLPSLFPTLSESFITRGVSFVLTCETLPEHPLPESFKPIPLEPVAFDDFSALTRTDSLVDYLDLAGSSSRDLPEDVLPAARDFALQSLTAALSIFLHAPHERISARLSADLHRILNYFERHASSPSPDSLRALGLVRTTEDETFLLSPRLRTELTRDGIRKTLESDDFAMLGAAERKLVTDKLLVLARERTLADLVLNNFIEKHTDDSTDVFRLTFRSGVYDIVLADREELTCELIKVKNETARTDEQLHELMQQAMLDTVEHRYGTITARSVLYLGRNAWHASGIAYRNIRAYL